MTPLKQGAHRLRNTAANQIRQFFNSRGFIECITPLLVKSPAIEPHLDAFAAHGSNSSFWLPTSPEFGLKKTIALEPPETLGIFEIAHAFRDDKPSKLHSPEFTMVEWYQRNSDYLGLAQTLIDLFKTVFTKYSIAIPPFALYTVQDYCARHKLNWPVHLIKRFQELLCLTSTQNNKSDVFAEIESLAGHYEIFFDEQVHPVLEHDDHIVFLYEFPSFLRAMSQLTPDGLFVKRIEAYYRGIELANGYQETSQPNTVKELFVQCNKIRAIRGLPPYPEDELLVYLTPAMQGVCGMALGLERMLMAFLEIDDIAGFQRFF